MNDFVDKLSVGVEAVEQPLDDDQRPAIAIVGLAGRFPGARSVAEFWQNLCAGKETISRFSPAELDDDFGPDIRNRPDFVPVRSVLDGVELFDAEFFGMLPRDAAFTDPQQRIFLECCWEALENAGHDPATFSGRIGVYAGSSLNTYLLRHICGDRAGIDSFTSDFQVSSYSELVGSLIDFLATRVSYKLDLKGPGVAVQSACSTSLLAIAQASQGLLNYQCDMALAGGVSITFPQHRGYLAQEGGMVSPDGKCRPFDSRADGTVFGSGAGVVLLKRLEDAVRDGDHIYSVIRGFGVNNDGSGKVGFAAPSVEGQSDAIAQAHAMAGVTSDSIGYVEAHGTGTPLGDPIEFTALVKAFRETSQSRHTCILGSMKANMGHLDAAAGVLAVIKTALTLREETIPPLINYITPNPHLDVETSPFKFVTELTPWPRSSRPRVAGVSSFGVGGTNVHVVMEEAPPSAPRLTEAIFLDRLAPASDGPFVFPISARTPAALDAARQRLATHVSNTPGLSLADTAWTLQIGRRPFKHRATFIAAEAATLVQALEDPQRPAGAERPIQTKPRLALMFPGQGSQHYGMGRELYARYPAFREAMDECAKILAPLVGFSLTEKLYGLESAADEVNETWLAQPAIFAVEYSLAKLWQHWGLRPSVMIGHSVGEFVAACLAGVFPLDGVLRLIASRGRLMQDMPRGGMLSVRLSATAFEPYANADVSIAAINSPTLVVAAGPIPALEELERRLTGDGVLFRRLQTSHAFHSSMMDPAVEPFLAEVEKLTFAAPSVPIISSVTGKPLTPEQATDPHYWARHLRETVAFSPAVAQLRDDPDLVLLEVGPGATLATLARQHPGKSVHQMITSSLPPVGAGLSEDTTILKALGQLWQSGLAVDWRAVQGLGLSARTRVPLPTYPFERKRHWIDRPNRPASNPLPTNTNISRDAVSAMTVADQGTTNMSVTSVNASPVSNTEQSAIERRALQIFEKISGLDLAAADTSQTFLDMGFDSLLLTQAARALQNEFGVKLAFRQLMGDQATAASLARYVLERRPTPPPSAAPAAPPAPTVQAAAAPVVAPPGAPVTVLQQVNAQPLMNGSDGGTMERLMREQLALVQQVVASQIDVMKQFSGSAPAAAASTLTAPAIAPPAIAIPSVNQSNAAAQAPAQVTPASTAADSTAGKTFGPFKGIQARNVGDLTAHQRTHLAALVERISKRAPKSKASTQANRQYLADPRVVTGFRDIWKEMIFPVVASRSKGSRIWDVDGNEYIDMLNGFGPIMFGHRPDFVETAMRKQLEEGFEIGPQTPLAGEIAKMFCELTGNERMTFCNTGSEAVMAAFRVARTVTGRDKIVSFSGDYHGMFDEVLVHAGASGKPSALPIAPGIPSESVANMVVLEYGVDASLEWIRANARDIAAVIVEPVQSRRPNFQPVAFLKEVRRITQENEIAFVFDEVVTGFRAHPGGCQALFGIRADMATYGKVLGGGMPIGVLAGKAEYLDALDGGAWQFGDNSVPEVGVTFFAGTFVRHPLTLAAVRAVLLELKASGPALQERLTARTTALVERINAVFDRSSVPMRFTSFASVFFARFPVEERLAGLFYYFLRENGLHVLEGFPCFMTTAHTDADLDKIVAGFEAAAKGMQAGHFFNGSATYVPGEALPATIAPLPIAQPAMMEMTEPQREIFLSSMIDAAASCAFNEGLTIHLDGALDVAALQSAFDTVVARHEALRARFESDATHLKIEPPRPVKIDLHDISNSPEPAQQSWLAEHLNAEAQTPFDLENGPVIKAWIARLAPQKHLLFIGVHHIVCDGWSANVIIDELAQLYTAAKTGAPASLPPAISFARHALQERNETQSEEGLATEKYWLDLYRDIPRPIDLPTDRPRGPARTSSGATLRREIPAAAAKRWKDAAAAQKSSLFMVLLAGFNALVSRLAGTGDVVIAVPMAGQSRVEGGNLVGHCVNFLPLRTRIGTDTTFAKLLAAVREGVLDASEHQAYTYGTLVNALAVPRNPARLPLTELQFNLEQIGGSASFHTLTARIETNAKAAVNSDLFVNVVDTGNGLTIYCDYNTDLFDASTISGFVDSFEKLLDAASLDPAKLISGLPVKERLNSAPAAAMSEADAALMANWNETTAPYPSDTCLHQLFEEQVARTPDALAITQNDVKLTYEQLNQSANRLAHKLIAMGAAPGTLVGICLERTPQIVVALLAVLKTGAAYVPLDPTHPVDRIGFMLNDSGIGFLVTQEQFTSLLPPGEQKRVWLDTDAAAIAAQSTVNPSVGAAAANPAYVMYTSGSTGKPKGVSVPHTALANFLWSMQRAPGLTSADVVAAVTTITFDIAGLEIYLPLVVGARVDLVTPETARDANKLAVHLAACGATVLQATPATWRMLVDVDWPGNPALRALCGGEALPRDLANALRQRVLELWNMYGPTETTIWSTIERIETDRGVPTIGRPIANTQIYILDEAGQRLPVGSVGEIWIGGAGVASGYHRRPDLTAQRFLPDRFTGKPGATIYRTGDLGRWHSDGRLEHLGRIDNQIKLRGFRVELGEIEETIQTLQGVKQTHIVADVDGAGSSRLVAFCVPASPGSVSVDDIVKHAARHLPEFMVPVSTILIDAFPLTANGKIDRAALLEIERSQRASRERTAPETPAEQTLVEIVCEVMRIETVGVTDNLFEIGVDSLKIFQIASRAAKAGLAISPRSIMKARTIRASIQESATAPAQPRSARMEIKPVARDRYRTNRTANPVPAPLNGAGTPHETKT